MFRTIITASIAIFLAATAATYAQYHSFDPCEWMEQDMATQSGLPRLATKAQIQSHFLVRGVTNPGVGQCVEAWWEFRADSPPSRS